MSVEKTESQIVGFSPEFLKEIEKYANEQNLTPKEFLENAAKKHLDELAKKYPDKNKNAELKLEIEYEAVTIKVPKNIMDLLRYAQKLTNESPELFIEYYTVGTIRSLMETNGILPSSQELNEQFNLNKIFTEILDNPLTQSTL